jgi:hypothetical protein
MFTKKIGLILLGLLTLWACHREKPTHKPSSNTIAFVHVGLLPLDNESVIKDQTVVVRDGKIIAVGDSKKIDVPEGSTIIDGTGEFLMPGLTDMHTHLNRPEDLLLYVSYGVTSVRNMWGTPMQLAWREEINKGRRVGPTLYTVGPIVDGEDPAHDGSIVLTKVEDVPRVIELHQKMGYDAIKVYNNLKLPVYQELTKAAKVAKLAIVGHVPREGGLASVLEAKQRSIEHMSGFVDALQFDAPRPEGTSRIDYIDESKIPALVEKVKESGVWLCPTRSVRVTLGFTGDETRAMLSKPEMKYVPAASRAVWEPRREDDVEDIDFMQKEYALMNRMLPMMHKAGVRFLIGTDPGNPLIIPGYTVHDELQQFLKAGFTPLEVLQIATRGAAEFLGDNFGKIEVGQRADLLLLKGNPLKDISQTRNIEGVMLRGFWIPRNDIEDLLSRVASSVDGEKEPFVALPRLGDNLTGVYRITWKGTYFGTEEVLITKENDQQKIEARYNDPHKGQQVTMHLWSGVQGNGQRLQMEITGAAGTGKLELKREQAKVKIQATQLSGLTEEQALDLPDEAILVPDQFIAGKLLWTPRLLAMSVGQALEVQEASMALGSTTTMQPTKWTVTRGEDTTITIKEKTVNARSYQLKPPRGSSQTLLLNEAGLPLLFEIKSFGLRIELM